MREIAIIDGTVIENTATSPVVAKLRAIANLLSLSALTAGAQIVENLDSDYVGIALYRTRTGGPVVLRAPKTGQTKFTLVHESVDGSGADDRFLTSFPGDMGPADLAYHTDGFLKSRGLIEAPDTAPGAARESGPVVSGRSATERAERLLWTLLGSDAGGEAWGVCDAVTPEQFRDSAVAHLVSRTRATRRELLSADWSRLFGLFSDWERLFGLVTVDA
ncbi:hypothetical protein [Streptomyces nanshensis]|uniref:Uncharacterized protein n=1 Tax=Streptomyces nanshensis TaxID=518642 RepID=A0A1E7LAY7_9ACTN|nr:hypothetical protein [Streptomyces nanshensis]OEV13395.1 hypothetical protein AN218_03655 [Streptomyces nanshensis]